MADGKEPLSNDVRDRAGDGITNTGRITSTGRNKVERGKPKRLSTNAHCSNKRCVLIIAKIICNHTTPSTGFREKH